MDNPLVVGIRWGLYLTLSATFGVPLFALVSIAPAHRDALPLRTIVGLSAAAALGLSLLGWIAMTAAMAGKPLAGVTRDDLGAMNAMPGLGASWLIRIAALVVVLGASIARFQRMLLAVGVALGAVALGSLAWVGHGAAGDGIAGPLHLAADGVHLLAAGVWTGALIALSLLLWRAARDVSVVEVTHAALSSFGRAGTIIVAAIVGSGLVNSWVLIGPGQVLDLPGTLWGRLLLAKLALFAAMLGLAGLNRWVLTPALGRNPVTIAPATVLRLRRSVMVEAGAVFTVLALVAWLGTLSPPALN